MRPVRSLPRFRCDFCTRTSTEASMKRHEKRCYRNPDRFCDYCKNEGYVFVDDGAYYGGIKEPCFYCSRLDESLISILNGERQ